MTPTNAKWEDKIYDILYKNSCLSDGNIGVRVLHEDEWPIKELAELLLEREREYKKREKLIEGSFVHRIAPVVNLDDESNNCDVCGYDHEYKNKFNENAYKLAHALSKAQSLLRDEVKIRENK